MSPASCAIPPAYKPGLLLVSCWPGRFGSLHQLQQLRPAAAKVDRGFVVIVPGTSTGDQVAVEIESVYENFALGSVVDAADDW